MTLVKESQMNRPSGPEYDGSFTPWLGVRDLRESISWYSEKLGLEVSFLAEEAGWCELGIGAEHVFVGLYRMDSPGVRAARPSRSGCATWTANGPVWRSSG